MLRFWCLELDFVTCLLPRNAFRNALGVAKTDVVACLFSGNVFRKVWDVSKTGFVMFLFANIRPVACRKVLVGSKTNLVTCCQTCVSQGFGCRKNIVRRVVVF